MHNLRSSSSPLVLDWRSQFGLVLGTALALTVIAGMLWSGWGTQLLSTKFLPHSYCYLQNGRLVWSHVTADAIIALAYLAISISLAYLVFRARKNIPFHWMFLAFGLFIVACGATHLMEVITVWHPVYVLSAVVKVFTAIVSLATAIALPFEVPEALGLIEKAKIADESSDKLRESEARLRAITDTAPDAIISMDSHGRVRYSNPTAERLFGYSQAELVGMPLTQIMPERFQDAHTQGIRRFLKTRVPKVIGKSVELPGRRREGTEFPLSISISAWESSGETYFTGILRDLSDQKQAEKRFEALLESAPDAMVIVDKDGTILLVNSQTEAIFGYTKAELLGKKVETLMPHRFGVRHLAHLETYAAGPRPRPMGAGLELYGLRKNGEEFPVEISLSPLNTNEGVLILSAIRDVTERKHNLNKIESLNRDLEKSNSDLVAANRELEAFSYSVSHDLRAPLRQIDGFASILSGDGPNLTNDQQHCLQQIRSGTRHMAQLVDALLNFSRLGQQAIRREEIDLNLVVQELVADLQHETNGRTVRWNVGPLSSIRGDRALVRQAFWNLLSNALKFTATRDIANIDVGGAEDKQQTFFVRDNGVGFDMKYADKLFGVFQRLHLQEEFEGTGVGLATVQRIVLKHGGTIWATASPGSGASFFFSFGGDPASGIEVKDE